MYVLSTNSMEEAIRIFTEVSKSLSLKNHQSFDQSHDKRIRLIDFKNDGMMVFSGSTASPERQHECKHEHEHDDGLGRGRRGVGSDQGESCTCRIEGHYDYYFLVLCSAL